MNDDLTEKIQTLIQMDRISTDALHDIADLIAKLIATEPSTMDDVVQVVMPTIVSIAQVVDVAFKTRKGLVKP
jgi:2-keto-3-deoxy-L-rhamnonate aldolase RhmA